VRSAALLLVAVLALFGADVQSRIAKKERELKKTERRISGVNSRLKKIAREIRALQKEVSKLDKKIAAVDAKVASLSKEHKVKLQQLMDAKNSVERLTKRQELLQKELSKAIARSFSKSLLLSSLGQAREEDVITEEILRSMQRREEERLAKLSRAYSQTSTDLERQRKTLRRLKAQIDDLIQERLRLKALKEKKRKQAAALARKQQRYNEELQRLTRQRQAMLQTLRSLKIIKLEEKRAKSKKRPKVKNYGSYRFDRTVRYKGPKTIAPLKEFVITKKYGLYKDPIYNIEIPNENIELKPRVPARRCATSSTAGWCWQSTPRI